MNGGGFGGLDLGFLNPEQREYILQQLGDLSGQEEGIERQYSLAAALRRPEQNKRMDWGSQAARAISGIGSGLAEQRGQTLRGELGGKYQTVGRELARLGRRRPDEVVEAPYSYGDIWGQS